MTKYLKIHYEEDEFDEIIEYGIHKLEYEFHDEILKHVREKKEIRENGSKNRKQY